MRTIHILGILVLLTLALPASPAYAGGIVSVCDEAHLRAALADGGTVTFACSGTITLTATLTIGADTTIDGSGQAVSISGNNAVRVFLVNSGVVLNLNELTVADGSAENGSGVFVEGDATLIVSNSTFSGNTADSGGGIYNDAGGTVVVTNSAFSGNHASGSTNYYGGGIYNRGMLSVSNSTFVDNSASYGAGISIARNSHGTVTVSNCTFSSNDASQGGGGIHNDERLTVSNSTFSVNSSSHGAGIDNRSALTVSNSTFSGNAASTGGGIFNSEGAVNVGNSTFSDNSAGYGGGIYNQYYSLTVSNSTFSGNSASRGGGIYSNDRLTVSDSTFSGNRANYYGGGIFNYYGSTATVSNSTFSGNSAFWGGGTYSYDGSTATLKNTIVANSPAGGNCYGTITDGGGNLSFPDTTCPGINANPLLGPLQDNGGPTWTMALSEGSAALDAGDDAICAAPPVNNLDQRGVTRPQGPHCDIGAVEQIQEPAAVSLSVLSAQSLPGALPPTIIAGLLLAALVGVGVRRRRHT